MKLTIIILTFSALHVSAIGLGQDNITLSLKNAPLQKVFSEIRKQTGYDFLYKDVLIENAAKINIEVKNASLTEVLDLCFKSQLLTYSITGKIITVKPRNTPAPEDHPGVTPTPLDVKGRVVDEKGEPVVGVTVSIKGTNITTSTDVNGNFLFKTAERDVILVFTHVSMETLELKTGGKSEFAISLKSKVSVLSDIQVIANTGYQQVPKERATGSFDFVNNEELNRRVSTDILSRLEGVSSGLLFDRRMLEGNENSISANNIIIRGLSTLNEAMKQPLIVVNNMAYDGDIYNINPNDVESITILKDAAAASIWGARAGNGVIVITTKQGKFNQPVRVSLNTNVNILGKPDLFRYRQMSVSDYIGLEEFLFDQGYFNGDLDNISSYVPVSPVVEILAKQRDGTISPGEASTQIEALKKLNVRNDFEKYIYRTSVNQQYSVHISGGSPKISYSLSSGFDKNPSTLVGDDVQRITLRSTNTMALAKNLETRIDISYSNTTSSNNSLGNIGNGSYDFKSGRRLYPYAQLADSQGNPLSVAHDYRTGYVDTAGGGMLLDWQYRPLDEIRLGDNKSSLQDIVFNAGASYKFTSYLSGEINYQYEHTNKSNRNHRSKETYFTRNLINLFSEIQGNTIKYNVPPGGILFDNNSELVAQIGRGQVNFNKTIAQKHEVSAIAGAEIRETVITENARLTYGFNDKNYSISNVDFINYYPLYLSGLGYSNIPSGLSYKKFRDRFVSVYGNAAYTYDNRYTLSGSFRKDAANLFGVKSNNKWKPFWSIGGAWNISNESFYHYKLISYLRLRATYGYQGNVNNTISPKTILYILPASSNPLGINQPTASIRQPGDPSLSWETISQLNIGIDFRLLNDRISASIQGFRKKSNNLILNSVIDPTTGLQAVSRNSASIRNKGLEITVATLNIRGPLEWQTELICNFTKNEVTNYLLNDQNRTFGGNSGLSITAMKGKDPYGVLSYPFAGLDPTNGDPLFYVGKDIRKDYSSFYYQSLDTAHLVYHGSNIPRHFGSLNNTFTYKNIALRIGIGYKLAYYFFKNPINYDALFKGGSHPDFEKRWQKPGDEKITTVPSLVYPADTFRDLVYGTSSINVLKGDNIRLQYIQLSYNITKDRVKKLPVRSLQLYCIANNIGILWRANKEGLDPDYNTGNALFPPLKSFAFGLKTDF